MQENVTEYGPEAYRPGEQQHMSEATNLEYRYKGIKRIDTSTRYILPWGNYLDREQAETIMVAPPQNSWQNLTAMLSKKRRTLIPKPRKYLFNEFLPVPRIWNVSNTQIVFKGLSFMPFFLIAPIAMWGIGAAFIYIYGLLRGAGFEASFLLTLVTAAPFVAMMFTLFFLIVHFLSFPPRFILDRPSGMIIRRSLFLPERKIPFVHYDAILSHDTNTLKYGCNLWCRYKYTAIPFAVHVQNAGIIYLRWQFLQRFMDVTQPLPDIPALEPYRHLDPTTAEHDRKTSRPERFWRDKSMEEINAMAEEMAKEEENIQPIWPCTMAPFIEGRNPDEPMMLPIPRRSKKI